MTGRDCTDLRLNKAITVFLILVCAVFLLPSCTGKPKTPDLGSFTHVGDLSVSHDGSRILFTGCGHKDYQGCTTYRFDRTDGGLYRYIYGKTGFLVAGARYLSASMRFVFVVLPLSKENKKLYDDMQIALINDDGTGYRQLTDSKGMKLAAMLSLDEKTMVYFRGRERKSGKTAATDFDLYRFDLMTGKETQLTDLSFYGVSNPYFTQDGRHVVFEGDTPFRLPHASSTDMVVDFRKSYKERYKDNRILQYPIDGSGLNKEPVPLFTFGIGSRKPMVTREGSVWFEGISRGIRHCCRLPDGKITEVPYKDLGGTPTRLPLRWVVSFDGKWMVVLYEQRKSTGHVLNRSLGMYNITTGERLDLIVPSTAESIYVR